MVFPGNSSLKMISSSLFLKPHLFLPVEYFEVGQGLELHVCVDFLEGDIVNLLGVELLRREGDPHLVNDFPEALARQGFIELFHIGQHLFGNVDFEVPLFLKDAHGPIRLGFAPEDDKPLALELAVGLGDAVDLFNFEEILEQHF